MQPSAEALKVSQNGDWNYKEKDNSGSQYFCEMKMGNFGNFYQLLKAIYLHPKQQEHLSSRALFFPHILVT